MTRRRVAIGAVVALVLVMVAGALRRDDDAFVLKARFDDASGLRKDFFVKMGGVPVGRVSGVTLDENDVAVVSMHLDPGALPIGRDATATVRPSSLLGEHHVELERGDIEQPAPSGMLLPRSRTGTAIELDQVLAAFDEPTRVALGVFLNEQGTAFVGRGGDLATMLKRLPRTLDDATTVLADLGQDRRSLGRLVADSDRIVARIAGERRSLGRLIATADRALDPVAARRGELGQSIAGGARALRRTRTTLRRLRSLSRALTPAADGLRASAVPLRTTLDGIVPFAKAATPSLAELRRTAPSLDRLARGAEPTVASLKPVVEKLAETGRTFEPLSQLLDRQTETIVGFYEGYARAMAKTDSMGHIYSTQTVFENLGDAAQLMGARERARRRAAARRGREREPEGRGPVDTPRHEQPKVPRPSLPKRPKLPDLPPLTPKVPDLPAPPQVKTPDVKAPDAPSAPAGEDLLDFLLGA